MDSRIMAHMIAGYPDLAGSLEVARALSGGGAAFLEVQFPFSDPSADGPVIQNACTAALHAGFSVDLGFELIKQIVGEIEQPIFLMTYGSLVFKRGVERFVEESKKAGVHGLIVPDFMPGYDEGLYEIGRSFDIPIVPVLAPSISEKRLAEILAWRPSYLYAAIRLGITGSRSELSPEVFVFLNRLKKAKGKVLAGFGIQHRSQVEQLEKHVYSLIVGSALVHTITDAISDGERIYPRLRAQIENLRGGA